MAAKAKREQAEARLTGKEPEQMEMKLMIGKVMEMMNMPVDEIPREYNCLARSTYIGYQVERFMTGHGYISTRPPIEV